MILDLPRNGSRTAEPELLRKSDHTAPEIGSKSLGSRRVGWPYEHSNVGTVGLPSAPYPYESALFPTRNTVLDHPASNRTERELCARAPLAHGWLHVRWTNA